jgi:uncharacterized membrane protein YGL010W
MRSIDDWFDHYSADHQHPTNRLVHWICVPAILWSVIAALWVVPVPSWLGRPGFWAFVAMFASFVFYYRLSRHLGLAMALAFVVLGLTCEGLLRALGPMPLLWLAVVVFVLAWIGQFVGHVIEGRRPSFLTDLAYLLIGPAWLMGKTLRHAGIAY